MLLLPGTIITTERGRRLRVLGPLGDPGGQGAVWRAIDLRSGAEVAVKIFKDATPELWERCQHLVALNLSRLSEVFAAPTDLIRHGGMFGHVARIVPGKTLKDRLQEPILSYPDRIRIAIGAAHLVALLHERGAQHGDVQTLNFLVVDCASGLEVFGIDLDNLVTAKFPKPLMVGHPEFIAPEIRRALAKKQRILLTKETDSYALAVMLHDVLLWKHPASGAKDADEFEKLMLGPWAYDPANPQTPEVPNNGYPVRILSPALAAAFRNGLSPEPARRPSPEAWRKLLSEALFGVFIHPECGGPIFASGSINECPFCLRPFPKFQLHTSDGRLLATIEGSDVRIGRNELRSSTTAKPVEAVGRKIGPETFLEVVPGGSGVYRITRAGAIRIPPGRRALLNAGDILRIADIECHVQPQGGYCGPVPHVKSPPPAPAAPVPPNPLPMPPARKARWLPVSVLVKFAALLMLATLLNKLPHQAKQVFMDWVEGRMARVRSLLARNAGAPEWPDAHTNSLGMVFHAIPGSLVKVSIWETRVKDYTTFCRATGRPWYASDISTSPEHAAAWVSWWDGIAFCQWLTEQERAAGSLTQGEFYWLPKIATWRLAAGLTNNFDGSRASGLPHQVGNFRGSDSYAQVAPVGSFVPNANGIYDMAGNVWEWALDDDASPDRDTLLGGSWADDALRVQEARFRVDNHPITSASGNVGFRCVLLKRPAAEQTRGGKP